MYMKSSFVALMVVFFIAIGIYVYTRSTHVSIHNAVLSTSSTKSGYPLYPDPSLTPGDIIAQVSAQDICASGYAKSVRNVTVETKRQVYQEYGLSYPQPSGSYEVDHFIPLELGGSNSITNLWPQPANPTPGFHQKDMVENYLHDQVCIGKESLQQAQEAIQKDWYAVYQQIPHP